MSDIQEHTIGLVLEMKRSWGRDLLPGITEYARQRCQWNLVLLEWAEKRDMPISGYIGSLTKLDLPPIIAHRRLETPIVNISAANPPPGIPLVTHDNHAVGRLAALHLLEMGLRHFACATMPSNRLSDERCAGFTATLCEAGFPRPSVFHEVEVEPLLRIQSRTPGPLGVFAVTDRRARHVQAGAHAAQLQIPSEIVLVGCDNDPVECELSTIPLSSVALDYSAVGYRAAEALDAMLRGKSPPMEQRVPPVGVVRRRSSDFLHVEDPLVRRVLSVLRRRFAEPLTTLELAKSQGMTPRHLQRRFKAATGRTLQTELLHLRLDIARNMLLYTPKRISEIAGECGFTDFTRFPLYFRRLYGLTPRDYRARNTALRG